MYYYLIASSIGGTYLVFERRTGKQITGSVHETLNGELAYERRRWNGKEQVCDYLRGKDMEELDERLTWFLSKET
jgi:hypothetical protein